MNAMNWMKGVVVAVGLSLGGSAIAAGPGPMYGQNDSAGLYERQRVHQDHDNNWNDGWLNDRNDGYDRFDRHDRYLFRIGRAKIADGKALQARGENLLERARWHRSMSMARQAHRLILRGEALEREGRMMVRRARS